MYRFPILLHVLNAIWRPRIQITLTIVLFFILQYYFALIAYFFFHEEYHELCENLWVCFSVFMDQTFKVN